MRRNKKLIAFAVSAFALIGAVFALVNPSNLVAHADSNNYVLNLSSSNGAATETTYSTSTSSVTAKTKLGNNVTFAYANAMEAGNGITGIAQIKGDTSGYYMNTSEIRGITSIEVKYQSTSSKGITAELQVGSYSGGVFTASETKSLSISGASTSTTTFSDFSNSYGYFKFVQTGSKAIYLLSINVSYTCDNAGGGSTPSTTPVTGISVTPETLSLEVGQSSGLSKAISPSNATNQSVIWSSNANSVATVDENGLVNAVGAGSATITCTTEDGGYSDTCVVTVSEPSSGGETPNPTSSYELVTSASQLREGAKVVMVSRAEGVIAGTISSQVLSSVTFSGLTSETTSFDTVPTDTVEYTLEGSTGAWKFKTDEGYLGATTTKKLSYTSGTNTWGITVSESLATIQNTTSSYGRFLYNVSSPRFTTYTSDTSATMLLPELFINTGSDSTGGDSGESGGTEEPPVEEAALTTLTGSLSKTTYEFGETFDTSTLSLVGTFSDGSTENYTWSDIDEYIMLDANADDFVYTSKFTVSGEYALSVIIDDIESNTLSFYVNEEEVETPSTGNASIIIKSGGSGSTELTSSTVTNYFTATGINVTSVSTSKVYGIDNAAGFKIGSNKSVGSITFNFDNVVITGISLKIGRYSTETSTVKISTSANSTGETITLDQDYTSTLYNCSSFSSDNTASSSLTIASTTASSAKRFQLYEIYLTIGEAKPVAVTGVTLAQETVSVGVGNTTTLNATVLPTNASNKAVSWSSNATGVATVSSEGVVTGVAKGSAVITVKTSEGNFTDIVTVNVVEVSYDGYYKATTVDPNFSLKDVMENQDCSSIPSTGGTKNILVIPVQLSDYTFTSKQLSDLEINFNGTTESSLYWESVSSFYDESSFGNVHLNFEIADVWDSGYTAKGMASISVSGNYYYFTQKVVEKAVANYKSVNGNSSTKKFDSDGDGFIDAVWMIYSCPNYSNSPTIKNISTDYWAYVYWNNWNATASTSSPVAGAYAWASYDFMYEGGGTSKVDAHTYIHETGHLFGLDDYYNYDDDSSVTGLAGVDMMDYNVIDHNSWSKMQLGWVKPYVVTGNAEITINTATTSGDCILIPDVASGWNGTSYDEFLLLELYAPTGLNAKDATTSYNSANVFSTYGVRMYHVDSRLIKVTYNYGWVPGGYVEPTSMGYSDNSYYAIGASNTPSTTSDNGINSNYQLIHMIQAGGTNTYKSGGSASSSDLFKTGNTFSMASYGNAFFPKKTTFNNGNKFGYTISFVSVSASSATIRIVKI